MSTKNHPSYYNALRESPCTPLQSLRRLAIDLDRDGKLSQRYDSEIADGSGRFETRYRITDKSVQDAIRQHRQREGV